MGSLMNVYFNFLIHKLVILGYFDTPFLPLHYSKFYTFMNENYFNKCVKKVIKLPLKLSVLAGKILFTVLHCITIGIYRTSFFSIIFHTS